MKKKIDFQKLINYHNSYTLATQLDVFAWMIKTSWEYRDPNRAGVFEWLYGISSVGAVPNFVDNHGFTRESVFSIRERLLAAFARAVVDTSAPDSVLRWRAHERIQLGRYRMLDIQSRAVTHSEIQRLLTDPIGGTLNVQLNSFYEEARMVKGIRLTANREGWQVIMLYGFDDSSWMHNLLNTRAVAGDAIKLGLRELDKMLEETHG